MEGLIKIIFTGEGNQVNAIFQALTAQKFFCRQRGDNALGHQLCLNGFPTTNIHGDRTQHVDEGGAHAFGGKRSMSFSRIEVGGGEDSNNNGEEDLSDDDGS
ncbi:unnamed protein product [Lupinus luteus]|uniref:Uncharacterized protein n=1 Tax=Lupinus luteus TaxID=3873 RepID=A0AAV1WTG2_LUPLU